MGIHAPLVFMATFYTLNPVEISVSSVQNALIASTLILLQINVFKPVP